MSLKSKKIIDIWEGEYRVFINFYNNREKYTLGYPKKSTYLKDVYFSINQVEQDRLSFSEANKYLSQGMINLLAPKVKGITGYSKKAIEAKSYGYCQKCGRRLRGDTSKKLCYDCWINR